MARGLTASHSSAAGARSLAGSSDLPHLSLHSGSGSASAQHIQNLRAWLRPRVRFNRGDLLPGVLSGRQQGAVRPRAREVKSPPPHRQPINTEERPTAAVVLSWSSIITLVRRADTVRGELRHRSPLSHLSESPLPGLAAGYRAPG